MDAAYRNAMARRDSLAAQIDAKMTEVADLKAQVAKVDGFLSAWHEFAGTEDRPLVDVESGDNGTVERTRTTGNPLKEYVAEATRILIEERNAPIPRSELYRELSRRGVVIRGAEPEKTLSTMLWRMRERVVRLRHGGYWLADKPSPDGTYNPAQHQTTEQALEALGLRPASGFDNNEDHSG